MYAGKIEGVMRSKVRSAKIVKQPEKIKRQTWKKAIFISEHVVML